MTGAEAIILAAGLGQRMGARTKLMPKGLIDIGGEALVQRSVRLLLSRGVTRIRIVTGHLSGCYEEAFSAAGGAVELVYNPDYATTGSLRSLALGLAGVTQTTLILESDIIYERRALDPLLSGGSGMVVSGTTQSTDEVYTWAHEAFGSPAQLLALSKDPKHLPSAHFGELTGLTRLAQPDIARMQQVAARTLRAAPRADYEDGLVALAEQTRFDCHLIKDLAWTEIDNAAMLERARSVVWPRIRNGERNNARSGKQQGSAPCHR